MSKFSKEKALLFTNGRIKYYRVIENNEVIYKPIEMLVFPEATFKPDGWESCDKKKSNADFLGIAEETACENETEKTQTAENLRKSFSRAKNRLFDLLLNNEQLDVFVTITFNAEMIDRYSYEEVVRKTNIWLDNRVRRNGLGYILVPEFHKDKAIHFHGVMNYKALCLADSGKKLNGKKVYNISDFPYGFTWVQRITDKHGNYQHAREAVGKYIYKYVTKTKGQKVGGRYYLHGGKLHEPHFELVNVDYMTFDKKYEYTIENTPVTFKKVPASDFGHELFNILRSVKTKSE